MGGNLVQVLEWRALFFILASLAVPVILFCLLAPAVELKGATSQTWDPEHAPGMPLLKKDVPQKICTRVYTHIAF
jgi:predicted MFS family arabinose efflux permease